MILPDAMFRRMAQDLRNQIATGVLGPGDQLPTETELMDAYECSRIVPQQALAMLAAEGLIIKRHGKGSFVRSLDDGPLRHCPTCRCGPYTKRRRRAPDAQQ